MEDNCQEQRHGIEDHPDDNPSRICAGSRHDRLQGLRTRRDHDERLGRAGGRFRDDRAREANFKAIGKANKAAKSALEAASPDFATVAASATSIQTDAGKIVGLFPDGSGKESGEKTEALPTIWQKPAEFKAAADKLATAAGNLKVAADAKDAKAATLAMGEIGGACKGCHDTFREKKQ
ncbi:cytochrome c [Novosphingobium sp. ST904]|uniref:c-type cytochrome n=1 Tax=Novosphingobium sp. ST904 TaxID=1684385 RepID=UPI0006C8AAFD|nr:cytochrome c [Novosphingobium sp. ST904]